MALVAYDNSDSSEFEEEDDKNVTVVTSVSYKTEEPAVSGPVVQSDTVESTHSTLFHLLPQPTAGKSSLVEEDDEFLHKKETVTNAVKPKAKITVPSLSDFKDMEDSIPSVKPKMANGKKSGLLSMLPQPKNAVTATTKSLVPQVLTQKQNTKKKEPLPSPAKKHKVEAKLSIDYSDDSDDDVQNDFFSINKPIDIPDLPLDTEPTKEVLNAPSQREIPNIQSYFKQDVVENHVDATHTSETSNEHDTESASSTYNGHAESSNSNEGVLDEEAILKLCGTRAKRKREDIQIVEVNQQEVLADAREWLRRGLMDDTSKRVSSSKKTGNEPTSQQRRKHQITYLAHQAKANEHALQNQWANSRMSRRQTQSKYGF